MQKLWQPIALVVTTLLLANGAAAHEAPLPAPFALFDRPSILDAIVKKPPIANAVEREHPITSRSQVTLANVALWNSGGSRYLAALAWFEQPFGYDRLEVDLLRASGKRLFVVGRTLAGSREPHDSPERNFRFDFAPYRLDAENRMFGIRHRECLATACIDYLTLYGLAKHGLQEAGIFLVLGREYGKTVADAFEATLRTVPHFPYNDVDLVTRERDYPPLSQRYRFNGHFFKAIKVDGVSLVPTVPLRYDSGQRTKIRESRLPVMVPTQIPAEWIGQSPSVREFAYRHLTVFAVSIGYGRDCDGTTACTDANVGAVRTSLASCNHAKALKNHDTIAFDTCGHRPISLKSGRIAWFERRPCGANCEGSDELLIAGPQGMLYQLTGKAIGVGNLLLLANSLRPLADIPHR